jgi:hypothetical protein
MVHILGWVQRRGGLGFTAEAGERLRVMGNGVGKEFDDDEAMQAGVLALVHHAHAAATDSTARG